MKLNMKLNRKPVLFVSFIFWLSILTACGIPGDLKKEAQDKSAKIDSARSNISKQKSAYLNLKKTDRFAFFAPYAERENWERFFKSAEDLLNQVEKEVTSGRVAFLLKENKKDKAGTLRVELAKVDRTIRQALNTSKGADNRMTDLVRIRDNAPQLVSASSKNLENINRLITDLEQNLIPKAQGDYPDRAQDILKRFAPVKVLQTEAGQAFNTAKQQLDKHKAGETADYAVLGAGTDKVNTNLETLKKQDKDYRTQISQLYKSYSKILEDMRIDHFIIIGRTSWDENSDFWKEHNYTYPAKKVKRETYEYFVKLNPNTVTSSYVKGWLGGYRCYIHASQWNALKIDPAKSWPSRSDNVAEFWVADTDAKAYHKYTMIENGEQRKTDWVEVDEEDYYEFFDFLGMEIVSKPYGFFEDEKINEPSPPGMGYVGDSRYGEWRTDRSTGRSFWYYYGIYAFLNRGPGYYYYRGDWNRWRRDYRNKGPYYGRSSSGGAAYGTYGTNVRTDSRYRNTDFARKGGLKGQAPSVRGAGPARRGGGPGGRGK